MSSDPDQSSFDKALILAKRTYYGRPRSLLYVAVLIVAVGAGLLWHFGGSIGDSLAPNLLADAIMLAVGYIVFERLIEAEADRKNINDDRVVFNAVQSAYRKAFYLWAGLVALGYGRDRIEKANFGPFSSEAREAIEKLGKALGSDPDRVPIMENISSKAKELETEIDRQLISFGQLMDPYLRRQLVALKESKFLAHCSYLASTYARDSSVLWTIGGNILWDAKQHKELIESLFPGRSMDPDVELGRENESIETIMTGLHRYLSKLSIKVAREQQVWRLPYDLKGGELVSGLVGLRGIPGQNPKAQGGDLNRTSSAVEAESP
ncbi:hypothetical protein [Bradyrhizobium sp. USDA 3650]